MPTWPSQSELSEWAAAKQLHVSTLGRRSGEWRAKWWLVFAVHDATIYLLEEIGHQADWIRNIVANPRVRVWIDGREPVSAAARIVTDDAEIATARRAVAATSLGSTLQDLIEWGLSVAIEVDNLGERVV